MMAVQPALNSASREGDPLELLRLLLETPLGTAHASGGVAGVLQGAVRSPVTQDDLRLLQALLEAAPALSEGRMRPVMLRSTEAHRQLVLGHSRPASSFDTLLLRAQQLMLVGAVLTAGYWFADGPLRDWLHTSYRASAAPIAGKPRVPASLSANAFQPLVPTLVTAGSAPFEAFTAPRQIKTVVGPTATATPDSLVEAELPDTETFMAPRQRILLESQVSPPTPVPTGEILPTSAEPTHLRLPSIGFDTPVVEVSPSQANSPAPVPTREILPTPAEPTHLLIPSIGLDTPVVEVFPAGDTWESAEYAAGFMHGTARAGEGGNMAISGHLGFYGGVFANLSAVQPGDDIFVEAAGWRYHYRMRGSQVVWPNQVEVLYPEETTTLTLITCTNWDTQRLIVTADLLGWQLIGAQ